MDVFGAVSRAIARTQRVLFRPFDVGSWLAFGFVFLLAGLVDPVADWNGKLEVPDFGKTRSGPTALPDPIAIPPEIQDVLDRHGVAIGAAIAATLVLALVVGVVLTWVGCRGLMMSYRSISLGYVGIGEAWRETAKPAAALFRIHLVVGGIGVASSVPLVIVPWRMVAAAYASGERDLHALVRPVVPFALVLGLVGVGCGIILFVARQLVAPFLLFFRCSIREAWARFFRVLRDDTGGVALFALMRVLLAVVVGVLSSFLSTITCCIGGLPLLHQALLAPVLAFDRAFTLHALASIGPEYGVMAPDLPAYAPATPWRR